LRLEAHIVELEMKFLNLNKEKLAAEKEK